MFENGTKLREFFKKNGIEITKVAGQLNVTRQTIDRWLTDNKNLKEIFEAAALPFLEYLNENMGNKISEPLVSYLAKKTMDLEKENEKLKEENQKLQVNTSTNINKSIIPLKSKERK